MAVVLPFTTPYRKGWSSAEHAEFVRATAILRGSGLPVAVESGVSDEGDPWTVFLREDTGDVIVHIAKIDGLVVAASAASDDVVSGPSFRSVVDRIIRHQPLVLPTTRSSDKVFMHPTAVITAFVATALVWSYNDDANLYRNDLTADDDQLVARAETARAPVAGAGILREGLLSKSEVANLGLDSSVTALSNRFVLAAGLAAIAVALDLTRFDSLDSSSTSLAQGNNDHQSDDTLHQVVLAPGSAAPAFDIPVDTVARVDGSDLSLLPQDEHLIFAAVSREPSGDSLAPLLAANVHQTSEHLSAEFEHASGPSYFSLEGSFSRLGVLVGSEGAGEHRNGDSPGTASVPNGKASASPPPPSEAAVAVASGSPPAIHVKNLAPDATELVSHLISAKDFSDANGFLFAKQIQIGIEGTSLLQGHAVSGGTDLALTGPDIAASSVTSSQNVQTAAAPDSYRIFDDILAFASDRSHEISASAATLQSVVTALDANPYLPSWGRILIIDLPDLRADAFKFTNDIVMISQDLASHLLPDTQMQAQAELGLVNGTTLKLIGVIDLHPDHAATV